MHSEKDSNDKKTNQNTDSKKSQPIRQSRNGNPAAKEARGAWAGYKVVQLGQRKYPNDPKKQMAFYLGNFVIMSGIGRLRPVSEATKTTIGDTLFRAIDELKAECAVVRNLTEFRKVHAERLIKHWINKGQSAGTIQNKISILRRFYTYIGKETVIPKNSELKVWLEEKGIQLPGPRSIVARESKAWDDNQVDVFEVVERIRQECEVTAKQLEMQFAFGLRTNESIQIIPTQSDRGDVLSVLRGTKGGMPREVRFDNDEVIARWQREVLEQAKLIAAGHPKGTLSIPGKSLAQSKSYFYYLVRKHGIRKDGLGVTAHGLRHQFAARRYRQITGHDTPVSGAAPVEVNPEIKAVDLKASQEVSVQLGHFRPSITRAYVGSFSMAAHERTKRIEMILEKTEGDDSFVQALRRAGIKRAWLTGPMALGVYVPAHQRITLLVSTGCGDPANAEMMLPLMAELTAICGRGVHLTELLDPSGQLEPADAIELNLHIRRPGGDE